VCHSARDTLLRAWRWGDWPIYRELCRQNPRSGRDRVWQRPVQLVVERGVPVSEPRRSGMGGHQHLLVECPEFENSTLYDDLEEPEALPESRQRGLLVDQNSHRTVLRGNDRRKVVSTPRILNESDVRDVESSPDGMPAGGNRGHSPDGRGTCRRLAAMARPEPRRGYSRRDRPQEVAQDAETRM